ncbi:MAG: DUF4360 domain-containing protein [Bdellovibrionaceae bacterium]|nr:DUF4360 domain-containing protein [Pseudobdellovibrionaceae bacterium]
MVTKFLASVVTVASLVGVAQANNNDAIPKATAFCSPPPQTEIPEFAIGEPTTKGSGCPAESVGVSITPDKKTVSFIFDSFISEAGNSVELKRDHKRCLIHLPIDVPKGWQVTVVKMDQRGFYSVPNKATAQLKTSFSLTDKRNRLLQRSLVKKKDIRGPADDEYTISTTVKNHPIYSQCGQKVNFRIDTEIEAKTNKAGEDVLVTVDSLDASASNKGYWLQFMWKKCK